MEESSLVAAAKFGQKEAFNVLCERLAPKILRSLYRITKNREDAEDALQDAFLRAFVHIVEFDGRSKFSTWLTRIAINSALMILRKKRTSLEVEAHSVGNSGSCSKPRTTACSARTRIHASRSNQCASGLCSKSG
jgi:RNA polymerase sigma-70 factor (ECF subfamily)